MPTKDTNLKQSISGRQKRGLAKPVDKEPDVSFEKEQTPADFLQRASFDRGRVTPSDIQVLQGITGNRSVSNWLNSQTGAETLVQCKLTGSAVLQRIPDKDLEKKPAGTPDAGSTSVSDPVIDALDLAPIAKTAAQELKKNHPEITFTSGRRDIAGQAHAMATNVVGSDRKWIENTYKSAAKLQKWVDDHPDAKTVDAVAAGLEQTMNAMTPEEVGKVSKHLSGEAFDVQPQEKDADAIKKDIQALPGLSRFLEKEGGLVRWHAQF